MRSIMPFCISIAQRTASTTLLNSMRTPSPVRLTMRLFVDEGLLQLVRLALFAHPFHEGGWILTCFAL